VVVASADALVDESLPATNFGTRWFLATNGAPQRASYVRFNVTGLTGGVDAATLRVWAYAGSTNGFQVRSVGDNTWGEALITWNNAPARGGVAGTSGAFGAGWVEANVTSLVTGNGLVTMALTTAATEFLHYAAREDVAHAPELVIVPD
jgi:hypothetical protein